MFCWEVVLLVGHILLHHPLRLHTACILHHQFINLPGLLARLVPAALLACCWLSVCSWLRGLL